MVWWRYFIRLILENITLFEVNEVNGQCLLQPKSVPLNKSIDDLYNLIDLVCVRHQVIIKLIADRNDVWISDIIGKSKYNSFRSII